MSDLISRQALHERINETVEEGIVFSGMTIAEFFHLLIDEVPSADTDLSGYSDKLWEAAYERGKAERKSGTWEWDGYTLENDSIYRCSECKGSVIIYKYDYCPHCGAKMDEEE